MELDHKNFLSHNKSMLIAPAGHGKTYSISECINYATGRILILTHTHAGVGSIRSKMEKMKIVPSKYHVETIMGFAQKYAESFYCGHDMPDRGHNSNVWYDFIVTVANRVLSTKPVSLVLKNSYTGIFVDEYQDCTIAQHEFVLSLGAHLPVWILGDPMQGIFTFDATPMVDMRNVMHMEGFHLNQYFLNEPWRWKGVNEKLGEELKQIRQLILEQREIDLKKFKSIQVIIIAEENDIYDPRKDYHNKLSKQLNNENVLILHPETTSINPRKKLVGAFRIPINLLEAIDDKEFYTIAKQLDVYNAESITSTIHQVALKLFGKTQINNWFNENGEVKNKRKEEEKYISNNMKAKIIRASDPISFIAIADIFKTIYKLNGVRCYRKEMYYSLVKALELATINKCSVYESMTTHRNNLRRMGRKVSGRCIGTTLLTKGLEFEKVVVLNAHLFTCPRNLYVALTRATKTLVLFTKSTMLKPIY